MTHIAESCVNGILWKAMTLEITVVLGLIAVEHYERNMATNQILDYWFYGQMPLQMHWKIISCHSYYH